MYSKWRCSRLCIWRKKGSIVSKPCIIERQDASKYSVGDVVACTLSESTDKFYVIEEQPLTASTIQMLTEKNIHTTEYRQSDNAGIVAFSGTNYWSSSVSSYPADVYNNNSLLYPIVNEYVSYLNTKLTGATGSLLTYSQAVTLGCDDSVGNCSSDPSVNGGAATNPAPSWVYSTYYWTGSAIGTTGVKTVYPHGGFSSDRYDCSFGGDGGVRPVITISTSDIG